MFSFQANLKQMKFYLTDDRTWISNQNSSMEYVESIFEPVTYWHIYPNICKRTWVLGKQLANYLKLKFKTIYFTYVFKFIECTVYFSYYKYLS